MIARERQLRIFGARSLEDGVGGTGECKHTRKKESEQRGISRQRETKGTGAMRGGNGGGASE